MLLGDLVRMHASRSPDRPAVVADGSVTSWSALRARAGGLRSALGDLAPPGARVAVLAANTPEYFDLYYGVPDAGMILVPLNHRLHPSEVVALLRHCGATVLIGQPALLDPLESHMADLPMLRHVIAFGAHLAAGRRSYQELLDTACDLDAPVGLEDRRPAWIIYTSGTTGAPRGATLSHRNLLTGVFGNAIEFAAPAAGRTLMTFPLYHVSAASTALTAHLRGGTIHLMGAFDAEGWMRQVQDHAITDSGLAPTMVSWILEHPRSNDYDLSSLRNVIYGTAVLPVPLVERFLDRVGPVLTTAYGSSELAGACTALPRTAFLRAIAGEARLLASCGAPALCEAAIVDDLGQPVEPGTVGELLVRGDQVMLGYWDDPVATAETVLDGWLHTGDLARQDPEGFLYIADRKKDLIITGGENVYPRDVEEVLLAHPGILDAAVVGIPDPTWGERVAAVVVTRVGWTLDPSAVVAHCRDHLAGYKAPRLVEFVPELPRNAAGKVRKVELRARLTGAPA